MDKPQKMSVKDYLVKVISLKHNIPSSQIDLIISHQFDSLNQASQKHSSLELPGFGKFVFNNKKARKKLIKNREKISNAKKILEGEIPDSTRKKLNTSIENSNKLIESIKDRVEKWEQLQNI